MEHHRVWLRSNAAVTHALRCHGAPTAMQLFEKNSFFAAIPRRSDEDGAVTALTRRCHGVLPAMPRRSYCVACALTALRLRLSRCHGARTAIARRFHGAHNIIHHTCTIRLSARARLCCAGASNTKIRAPARSILYPSTNLVLSFCCSSKCKANERKLSCLGT